RRLRPEKSGRVNWPGRYNRSWPSCNFGGAIAMTIRVLSCLLIAFATCAAPVSGAPVKKSESLNKAIEALTREYKQQVAKDGESTRERSNYFENEKPEDVTVDALLAALEAPIKGLDARGNAWVKWQLLSALTEPLEDKQQLKQFVAIYRK